MLALAVLALAGGGAALGLLLSGGGTPAATYGGIPSWLPKPAVKVGRVVVATPAKPWRAIQGDTVVVRLGRGHVRATAAGPSVPEEGKFPIPAAIRCTFLVTFAGAAGAVPLAPAAFTIVDEQGALHHPALRLPGGGALPRRVPAGRTLTLAVVAMLPSGSGLLRWAPTGGEPVVSWDFDVEID